MADGTIFIFGASRGIGLGLVEEFLSRGWHVIASERTHSDGLHALACDHLSIVTADVTDPASYADLGLADGSLDAVVINAGISGAAHQSSDKATGEDVAHVMMTNAFGPVKAGRALLPKIRAGGTLGFMSSIMGSIADSSGGYELYRASKAALNMLAKGLSEQEAKSRDIEVVALHPGWVQTDMGGQQAPLTVSQSVSGLANVIDDCGGGGFRYLDYTGRALPF
ncbi:SDR family NAD(P)-dependent oxidoreductase [Erythrobacter sp.]|uniref:SDR family NAD(P)-dependent oxidoreductase n=1 Tax=Erythrobacter sp. TaxID=1042 RepID=UPI00311F72B2